MKKYLLPLLLLLTAMLFSCSGGGKAALEGIAPPCVITVSEENTGMSFELSVKSDGCEAVFLSPDALSGCILSERDGSCLLTLGDFGREASLSYFPPVSSLARAISPIAGEGFSCTYGQSRCEYAIDEMRVWVYYEGSVITKIETEEDGRRFSYRVVSAEQDEKQS